MGKESDQILEGLKIAIEAELTGHAFYQNAAKTTTDAMGKETFARMAEEEMRHFEYLRRQYEAIRRSGEYDFSEKLIREQPHGANPIFSDEIKKRIKDSHFEVSALTIGMKLELDAMNYYRACAAAASGDEVKQFYSELAAWEEDHFLALEQQLDTLKQEYFSANNFIPM